MKRKASAEWKGGLKDGKGTLTTDSSVLSDTQYSFSTRFENGVGTNPEELIAAAHAGCFSMALSGQLGNAGMTAESIRTTATVTLEKTEAGFAITAIHLDVTARIPGADPSAFETAAQNAKSGCPVSQGAQRDNHHGRQARSLTAGAALVETRCTKKAVNASALTASCTSGGHGTRKACLLSPMLTMHFQNLRGASGTA